MDDQKRNALEEQENTPWYSAMNCIIAGLALTMITFQFWNLDLILPAVGMVLFLLGFRALRAENGWFKACWCISVVRTAYWVLALSLNATIYQETVKKSDVGVVLVVIQLGLGFGLLVCLRGGLRAAQQKMERPVKVGCVTAFIFLYSALFLLALVPFAGLILGLALVVVCICILRSLYKRSQELDEAGYTIQPPTGGLSNLCLVGMLVLVLGIGIGSGYLFFSSYPMEWEEASLSETTEVKEIKVKLIELGFPENVLSDLLPRDILACEGAEEVIVEQEDHSVSADPFTTEQGDTERLHITGILVRLSGEDGGWKLFHHFRWTESRGFHGTEAIELLPAYRDGIGWAPASIMTGQVLYDKAGVTYAAPYDTLQDLNFPMDDWTVYTGRNADIYGTFSMPKDGENHRGYVSYEVEVLNEGWMLDAWMIYIHQRTMLQYPVQTAKEGQKSQNWFCNGAFTAIQDAIQLSS